MREIEITYTVLKPVKRKIRKFVSQIPTESEILDEIKEIDGSATNISFKKRRTKKINLFIKMTMSGGQNMSDTTRFGKWYTKISLDLEDYSVMLESNRLNFSYRFEDNWRLHFSITEKKDGSQYDMKGFMGYEELMKESLLHHLSRIHSS